MLKVHNKDPAKSMTSFGLLAMCICLLEVLKKVSKSYYFQNTLGQNF